MTPIIDIHAHVFSARDIPLKGYLRSRRDEGGIERWMRDMIPTVTKCIRKKPCEKEEQKFVANIGCKLTMGIVYLLFGMQYRKWVETLSKEVIDITEELVRTYQKDNIDLYVPLVIDYEYWFESTYDTPIKDQIDYMYKNIVLPYKGKIHPFVAFDPARELAHRRGMLNPDKKPEKHGSLQLVQDAIENKGFIGVKLYNSLGYRPFNNEIMDDKRRKKIKLHKKMGYYIFKGEDYDKVLCELYDYCVDKGVPITAHSVMDGIESYKDASFDFGHAVFWHEVLSQDKYKDLHVNLAHFGWGNGGYHWKRSWVKDICEMLLEYDNLYTDVSCHDIMSKRHNQRFKSDYEDVHRDWSNYNGIDGWSMIKKKVLFGIDWHVIKRQKDFEHFKDRYVEVLKHKNLYTDEDVDDFLGGNAVRFLGLAPGGKSRERLETFYKTKNIDLPEWFKSAGKCDNDG